MKDDVCSILSPGLDVNVTHLHLHFALCVLGLWRLDHCSYKDRVEEKHFKFSCIISLDLTTNRSCYKYS